MKGKLVQFLLYLLAFVFAVAIKIMATDSIGQLVLACFGGVGALFLLGHFIYHQVNRHRHEEKALRTKLKIPNLTKLWMSAMYMGRCRYLAFIDF